jgi:hypothetical protein
MSYTIHATRNLVLLLTVPGNMSTVLASSSAHLRKL